MQDTTLGFINTLCATVRQDSNLSQEAVGERADLDASTICRIELSEREAMARHVKALGELTHDVRLVQWMFPWIIYQPRTAERTPPIGDVKELILQELQVLEKVVPAVKYVHQIVGDGRVDESDDVAIADLDGLHEQVREMTEKVDRAIAAFRESKIRR